jgi:hypothetical protein
MKVRASIVIGFLSLCIGAVAQAQARQTVEETTVCQIVNHPLQFKGKTIRLRARVWSDFRKSWLNESPASANEIGKACRWLPVEFTHSSRLLGSYAFGTFTGRLVYQRSGDGRMHMRFLVEQASDIYDEKIQNGLVAIPRLYDTATNSLFSPQQ